MCCQNGYGQDLDRLIKEVLQEIQEEQGDVTSYV